MTSVFKALDRGKSRLASPRIHGWPSMATTRSISKAKKPIVFVSTMISAPWGGSEELWAQSALRLRAEGHPVGVSVHAGMASHAMVRKLESAGARIQVRRANPSWFQRIWRRLKAPAFSPAELEIIGFLAATSPSLVVLSDGNCMMPIRVLEFCVSRHFRFVTIGHMVSEYFGIEDDEAERYRALLPLAQRCYFVAKTNLKVFQRQIGCVLPNAAIVRNPFKVGYTACAPWPAHHGPELRLAHVGRLYPPSKGQDLLLEALCQPQWRERAWHLTMYGDGSMRNVVEKLINDLGLCERVTVRGFVHSIEGIWSENHVLVMPSRYEGLPLAIVEAMLCGRPVVATDVGGNAEVIEDGLTGFVAGGADLHSLSATLERLWDRRDELQIMGENAARAIRAQVPSDPIGSFVDQMKALRCW